ncbi:tyrosine-tyramine antiporter [Cetobacterium sp. SF1]|uniref:tyrosine-tyramine antiporter n=1 Tax=unclassified Cetobacterium TaxID=2630983 RepID=UPI003CFB3A77
MQKKLTLFQLIALSVAFYGSIRNIPTVASVGWYAIFYMICAAVLFAIPISLVAAELATGWPEEGGPQVWVNAALGPEWAFVTAWLLWVQMFFGMVMVSTAFAAMIPYIIGRPELANNNVFIVITVIITYWIITLLNFKAQLGKWISTWGAVFGIYIPATLLIVLGLWYSFKIGNVNLGPFTYQNLIPNIDSLDKLSFFAGICFIFAGLEIASVHANDIDNPKRNYPISVFITISLMVVFNLVAALTEANAIPAKDINLAVIIQPFSIYFNTLGIPWATNVLAFMIAFGVFAQLNAWVLGPSKAMIKVAEAGLLPPIFQKRNKDNIPVTFVLIQAAVITLVSLLYIVVPAINTGFIIILMLTTILYCIVYILILISEIVLKYKMPEVHRSTPVPGGKIGMWITVILAFIGVITTIIVSVIPNSDIPQNLHTASILIQVLGTVILVVLPLLIFKFKKPTWKKEM